MAKSAAARRGQPLLALGLLFAGWTAMRIAMWGEAVSPGEGSPPPPAAPQAAISAASRPAAARPAASKVTAAAPSKPEPRPERYRPGLAPEILQRETHDPASPFTPAVRWLQLAVPSDVLSPIEAPGLQPRRKRVAKKPPEDEFYEPLVEKDDPRWSGENWVLMRAGSGDAAQAPGAASYGASQAGAIVRYRLGRGEVGSSYAYLRTSLAINAPGQDREIALGFGLRPARKLPLRVLVEARLQDTTASPMQVRPVATVITELPWKRLPLGFRAEAYAQAGYAGGRGATPFFDAQAMIDHALRGVVPRNNDLRVGAGVWAGGQEGAVRLDAGPRVSFRIEPGRLVGPSRVALDWRFRLSGNARPDSGPALTVTSAF